MNPISSSSNFEDIIIGWYHNLLLSGNHSNDSTGVDNHLLAVYGLYSSSGCDFFGSVVYTHTRIRIV
jgi:hypothetical protein